MSYVPRKPLAPGLQVAEWKVEVSTALVNVAAVWLLRMIVRVTCSSVRWEDNAI